MNTQRSNPQYTKQGTASALHTNATQMTDRAQSNKNLFVIEFFLKNV